MAAITSTSCADFLNNFSANSVEHQSRDVDVVGSHHQSSITTTASAHASNNSGGGGSCTGKLDGVAMWIINGVANAFFASLDRCSCIRIATVDDGEDGYNDNIDLPLIFNDGNYNNIQREGSSCGRRRTKKNPTIILDQDKKNKAAAAAAANILP